MNLSHGLVNKLVYLAILILMLIPLFLLGQPSSGGGEQSGGQLTQMRDEFEISEADLGEINPASETMKLSTLGLRGPAATILWQKANEHKVNHEWDRLRATLNNISLLQPHFEKVWEFQAHNMSYNVSAEFDDYRQRYAWVIGGTEFLTEGVNQNRKSPALIWHTGWYYGQKLGMSDEKDQFRRLFRDDAPLHERIAAEGIDVDGNESLGPDRKPDNWLVGRQWLNRGYRMTREGGIPLRRKTPLHFYETGPKWLFNHAIAIEREGELSDASQRAWQNASSGWREYGDGPIQTTAEFTIRLNELDELTRKLADQRAEFAELTQGIGEQLRADAIAELTAEQREILSLPADQRNPEQSFKANDIERMVAPRPMQVARNVPKENKVKAIELANALDLTERRLQKVESYRQQVNYEYWATRAAAEQTQVMIDARRLVYEADQLNEDAQLDKAIEKYEQAWVKWAEVFEDYPLLVFDVASDDLMDSIKRYQIAIDSETFGPDFPLQSFVEMRASEAVSAEHYQQLLEEQRQRNAEQENQGGPLDLDFREMIQNAQESNRPAAESPIEEAPIGQSPAEEAAAEETPAEETAAEEVPAEEVPAEEVPAEEVPAEEVPAEEVPAEEAPAEEGGV